MGQSFEFICTEFSIGSQNLPYVSTQTVIRARLNAVIDRIPAVCLEPTEHTGHNRAVNPSLKVVGEHGLVVQCKAPPFTVVEQLLQFEDAGLSQVRFQNFPQVNERSCTQVLLCYRAPMRYARDGKWTPVPFRQRFRAAGWELLGPPLYFALLGGFIWVVLRIFFWIIPHSGSKPDPNVAMWLGFLAAGAVLVSISIREFQILNADTANFREMAVTRLADLEARVPPSLW